MSEKITILVEARINKSNVDELKSVLSEMMAFCSKTEQDVNIRNWYINEEQTKCMVFQEYKNSDAVLVHVGNYGEFVDSINEFREIVSIKAFGNPSEKLKNGFIQVGVKYSNFHTGQKNNKSIVDYGTLSEKIIIVLQARIIDSKANKLRSELNEMLEFCAETEPDVITRDCYINDEETTYSMVELYKNSDAVLFHIGNYGDYVDTLNECRQITSVIALGNPSDKLKQAFRQIGANQFDLFIAEQRS